MSDLSYDLNGTFTMGNAGHATGLDANCKFDVSGGHVTVGGHHHHHTSGGGSGHHSQTDANVGYTTGNWDVNVGGGYGSNAYVTGGATYHWK